MVATKQLPVVFDAVTFRHNFQPRISSVELGHRSRQILWDCRLAVDELADTSLNLLQGHTKRGAYSSWHNVTAGVYIFWKAIVER